MRHDAISLLSALPPVIERYELKYVIPHALIDPISRFLEPCCALDEHSLHQTDNFYPVNSLYFDTPNYRFLKLRMWGAARRFNMRVRAYGDGGSGPHFAEIKFKTPTCVRKFRARVEPDQWPSIVREQTAVGRYPDIEARAADAEAASRELFQYLARAYAIEPKIFTCYRRRAFVSRIDDYARVTLDVDMRYRHQNPHSACDPYSLRPRDDCINYDVQTIYSDEAVSGEDVILELKASAGAVPVWMIELIRRFELKQVGFSKYLNSSLVGHRDNGDSYMSSDRVCASVV